MLECAALSVAYGRHRALEDVALGVAPGEIVVILGANGAGKSTLLQAIAGLVPCDGASRISIGGQSIRGLAPHQIVEAGIALVPEGRGIFGDLRVEENLLLGAFARRARDAERDNLERVLALFPKLAERRRQTARTMSGGEQQMVAIGRAMMSQPTILMLDEPSLGLSPILCTALFRSLAEIRATGVGILLVEQNARQGLKIADRGCLLENGRVVGAGTAAELLRDPAVQKAYLGGAGGQGMTGKAGTAERAAQAGTPASRIEPRGPASVPAPGVPVDSISEMVRRAARVQAEHVDSQRTLRAPSPATPATTTAARSAPARAAGPRADRSLEDALAEIEAAAARARRPLGGASRADRTEGD